jgi:branched-chain amino acid transport system substrate-binding protein
MSKKGSMSTSAIAITIIALIVGVAIGLGAYPALFQQGQTVLSESDYNSLLSDRSELQALKASQLSGEIELGFLGSMTGDLASFGENEYAAASFAAEEVNAYLADAGANWTVKIVKEDTQTDPAICLEKVQSLNARGVTLCIGPLSSGEIRSIKSYVDSNKILIISQSSTAIDLALPDDYVFRFTPTDLGQGPAIARLIWDDNNTHVIPVIRNDAWGAGLEDAVEDRFVELGGTFLDGIAYTPGATEFSSEAADLDAKVASAVTTYGAANVAVLFIAFEEAEAFFTAVSAYQSVQAVDWYGSDGTALAGRLVDNAAVADLCESVNFLNTIFAPTHSPKWEAVRQNNLAEVGREPDSYSYAVYDVVWAYAMSILAVGDTDPAKIKDALPAVTESLFGASGWIQLDANGDRKSSDYDIWNIQETTTPNVYEWTHVGMWNTATDTITWD